MVIGGGNSKLQKLIWGTMSQEEKETYGMSKENRCSYREFLQRFVELQEVIKVDDDGFDYTWYNIGMELYDRMPFLEPLEY